MQIADAYHHNHNGSKIRTIDQPFFLPSNYRKPLIIIDFTLEKIQKSLPQLTSSFKSKDSRPKPKLPRSKSSSYKLLPDTEDAYEAEETLEELTEAKEPLRFTVEESVLKLKLTTLSSLLWPLLVERMGGSRFGALWLSHLHKSSSEMWRTAGPEKFMMEDGTFGDGTGLLLSSIVPFSLSVGGILGSIKLR